MKTCNQIINSMMIISVSLTIIRFIVDYIDLIILRPEVYAIRSAPWYAGGLLYCVYTLIVLLICIAIKAIVKFKTYTK